MLAGMQLEVVTHIADGRREVAASSTMTGSDPS
jgi:hypothetical protein